MNAYEVTVTWKAFCHEDRPERKATSATITVNAGCDLSPEMVCEAVFHDTNLYTGAIWDKLQPVLPPDRTHTALSVGDEVTVDGEVFYCDHEGWTRIYKGANQ